MLALVFYICLALILTYLLTRLYISYQRQRLQKQSKHKLRIGFLHPFCNDAGGGEKVLWCMAQALIQHQPETEIAIYSLEPDINKILDKINTRFGITLDSKRVRIIHVTGQKLLQPTSFLTMLAHIILPCVYAVKCLLAYQPDIFFDTTGYTFTMWVVRLLSPSTLRLAYIHYPFISQEMLSKVREKRQDFNNKGLVARVPILGKLKLVYYFILLKLYQRVQKSLDFAFANSSWTLSHLSLPPNKIKILFPPCNISKQLQMEKPNQNNIIMSFAQFRPEKRQELQLSIFKRVKEGYKGQVPLKFYMTGATRGEQDERLLGQLKKKVGELGLENEVSFHVNKNFTEILELFKQASHGLHTMESEHFGISVVEMMAAGMIVIAHDSAGPKVDIISEGAGYRADSEDDYVSKLLTSLHLTQPQRRQMIQRARQKVQQFSDATFIKTFNEDLNTLLTKKQKPL